MSANPYLMIVATGLVTMLIRGAPFLFFGKNKELPDIVNYLSSVLPASIMVILVIFGIRGADYTHYPYGLAELLSLALIGVVQGKTGKTFLSVFAGTACYMILIRML